MLFLNKFSILKNREAKVFLTVNILDLFILMLVFDRDRTFHLFYTSVSVIISFRHSIYSDDTTMYHNGKFHKFDCQIVADFQKRF